MKPIKIGIIGFGTVGTAVVRLLQENGWLLRERLGLELQVKKIADLDISSDRGLGLPPGTLTSSAAEVIQDPEVQVVVELIGGLRPAKDFILQALRAGKHVVTANKALLAEEGQELFQEAQQRGLALGFEASVAGGVPIIRALREGLLANRIKAVYGILNGTTNYILTKMSSEGVEYEEALREAQRLGYAEADPTLDVQGIDSAHKLTLLASLAFGIPLSFQEVYTEGISHLSPLDIAFASELGMKIKLLAVAKLTEGQVELRVHPTMLPQKQPISQVDGVLNAIYVEGDAMPQCLLQGPGAGGSPTASAVVSDLASIAHTIHTGGRPARAISFSPTAPSIRPIQEVESLYYFRFSALDRPGVLSKIAGVLGAKNISIWTVIQKGRKVGGAVPLVLLTHKAKEQNVRQALKEIDALPVVTKKSTLIRVEGPEE
jgi:homoserine dehydrogenase